MKLQKAIENALIDINKKNNRNFIDYIINNIVIYCSIYKFSFSNK